MEDQLVSFETAKLAKEKGFDIWNDSYSIDGELIPLRQQASRVEECKYPAPTQSLLQKWLRNKFHIKVYVASTSLTYHFPMVEILEVGGARMNCPRLVRYNIHEEALELGLQYGLKLIDC